MRDRCVVIPKGLIKGCLLRECVLFLGDSGIHCLGCCLDLLFTSYSLPFGIDNFPVDEPVCNLFLPLLLSHFEKRTNQQVYPFLYRWATEGLSFVVFSSAGLVFFLAAKTADTAFIPRIIEKKEKHAGKPLHCAIFLVKSSNPW